MRDLLGLLQECKMGKEEGTFFIPDAKLHVLHEGFHPQGRAAET
jgi:hypothetical protein